MNDNVIILSMTEKEYLEMKIAEYLKKSEPESAAVYQDIYKKYDQTATTGELSSHEIR